jgi:predicted TIM-barrel fold metal-dependent hydrolase
MVRVMDLTGCRTAVVSANRGIQQDAWLGNADVARAVVAHPGRILGYGVVNPWQDPERLVEAIADNPAFVGIKLHPSLHEYPLTGARYRAVWEWASQTSCPVLTHTWFSSVYDDPQIAGEVAEQYPGVTLLLGHSGVSPAGNERAVDMARAHPGIHLETCGSFQTASVLRAMVDNAGAGQVLFGSDFCFIDQRISLGRITFTGFDSATRDAVLAGNARRLFSWRHRLTS